MAKNYLRVSCQWSKFSSHVYFAAKNVYRVLFKNKLPQRNEMFAPGRMAYVIDLEDDFPESDIPTTAIRSKVSSAMSPYC